MICEVLYCENSVLDRAKMGPERCTTVYTMVSRQSLRLSRALAVDVFEYTVKVEVDKE